MVSLDIYFCMIKECRRCKEKKDFSCFYKRSDGYYTSNCKSCVINNAKIRYNEKKDEIKKYKAEYKEKNRDKIIEYMLDYNSRDDVKTRMVKYRQDNKKELRLKEREWHKNNPDKSRAISRKRSAKQREKVTIRVRANVSRAVNLALKRQGSSKAGDSTFKNLNYTLEDLKIHLENNFESWMNWDNYGLYRPDTWDDNDSSTWTWQIDHIICQADLLYDSLSHPNFKKCWDLSNLRPYSSKKNCLDGAYRVRNIIINEN